MLRKPKTVYFQPLFEFKSFISINIDKYLLELFYYFDSSICRCNIILLKSVPLVPCDFTSAFIKLIFDLSEFRYII